MNTEALEKLIEKYELQRKVVTELIQKSEPEEDSSTQLAVRRFLSAVIYDLKACVGKPDSDTSDGLHLDGVSNSLPDLKTERYTDEWIATLSIPGFIASGETEEEAINQLMIHIKVMLLYNRNNRQ